MAETKTAAAPKNAPKQSSKPGEPAPAAKKESIKRVPHPALKADEKGKATVQLDDFPADFDPKVHKPLRRGDFKNEAPFLERKATELEARARELRREADEARKLGSQADRAKAKKLRAMMDKMEEIKAQLKAQGIDVDAVVKDLSKSDESEAAKA